MRFIGQFLLCLCFAVTACTRAAAPPTSPSGASGSSGSSDIAPGKVPIITNGSFELGPPPFDNQDIDIPPGSTDITAWLVTGGGIDLLSSPWDVSDGQRGIDLDGRQPGGIQQVLATSRNRRYRVTFDMAGNPAGGTALKTMRVTTDGYMQDYSFDITGQSISSLNWVTHSFTFRAGSDAVILSFSSLSAADSPYGPLVDNVRVAKATGN